MKIEVNRVRLFVDIEGSALAPDGPEMRARPTLILLHGGPGADHSIFKPAYAQLTDLCQIVYLDHRGNGRSDDSTPRHWTLAQWGDDIAALCDVLGIDRPIVFGGSFGGFVAQSFATRHPDKIGALILSNTAARVDFNEIYTAFTRIGGAEVGAAARRYWDTPTSASRQAYAETCVPYYTRQSIEPDFWARVIKKDPVALHFNGPANEMGRFDFRTALGRLTCPSLVLSGAHDPIMPPVFSETIAASLTSADVTAHCLDSAAHLPDHDAPAAYFAHLRQFISRIAP